MKSNRRLVQFTALLACLTPLLLIIFGVEYFLSKKRNSLNAEARLYLPGELATIEPSLLKKSIVGPRISEGGLITEPEALGRHHDSVDLLLTSRHKGRSVWIFGDSWADGLKKLESKTKKLSKYLDGNGVSQLRIIATPSYSPLLINLAFRDRLLNSDTPPDIVVVLSDQSDVGDDYCRYRPFVWRNQDGSLHSVLRNDYELRRGLRNLFYYKVFGENQSGILYAFFILFNKALNSMISVPGITDCLYQDLMPWQLGEQLSPNGAMTTDYIDYYMSNIHHLISELRSANKNIRVILISHDWAQHSLDKTHPDYMPNNVSSLLERIASLQHNVSSVHIRFPQDYPGKSLEQVFNYPFDPFSHPTSYDKISSIIASQVKAEISKLP